MRILLQVLLIACYLIFSTPLFAQENSAEQAKGIEFFHGTWDELIAEAQKNNKPIFLDVFTSWCGPCKMMSSKVFTQPEVGNFYNQNFINYKIDAEKGEGVDIAAKYKVKAYPTMLFIDAITSNVIHSIVGARKPDEFIVEGKKSAVNKTKLAEMKAEYEKQKTNPEFMLKYIETLQLNDDKDLDKIANQYFSALSKEQQQESKNLKLNYSLATQINCSAFERLMNNKQYYIKEFGETAVTEKIITAASESINKAISDKDEKLFKKALEVCKKSGSPKAEELVFAVNLQYYKGIKDWKNYFKTALNGVDKYAINNSATLNNIAWDVYEQTNDKKLLEKAQEWAEKSVELNSKYHNNDTYASILYKLGKRSQAIAAAEKAIAIAKMEKTDSKATQQLLNKILSE